MKCLVTLLFVSVFFFHPALAEETIYEYDDPNYTRLFLTPTAETLKKGNAYFAVTEILLFQYAYGVTDSTQIGLSALPYPPIVNFNLKTELINKDNKIFSFLIGFGTPLIFEAGQTILGFQGGFIFSSGTRDSRFTFSTIYLGGFVFGDGSENLSGLALSAGFEKRTSEHMKLLFELTGVPSFINGEFADDFPRGFIFGPRFFGKEFAADVGFLFPLQSLGGYYFILPVVNIAYHF